MEKQSVQADSSITEKARLLVADLLDIPKSNLQIQNVNGGYSRNRRSLVGSGGSWVFVKEVDVDLLPGDGEEELWWLEKDHLCTTMLHNYVPELVPEWSRLESDGHVLILPSYNTKDGWIWSPPEDVELQKRYISAVIDATKELEDLKFDDEIVDDLKLAPFFRDQIALDGGVEQILQDPTIRERLKEKYANFTERGGVHQFKYRQMLELLNDDTLLNELSVSARSLADQPNDAFGHCDVRSDNLTFNLETGEVKLVDWNWASFTPKGFGATEFLIDMARRGADVTPWSGDLNVDLMAGIVGFYAIRSLKEPLMPGSTLRDAQAESAAVAYNLYKRQSEG